MPWLQKLLRGGVFGVLLLTMLKGDGMQAGIPREPAVPPNCSGEEHSLDKQSPSGCSDGGQEADWAQTASGPSPFEKEAASFLNHSTACDSGGGPLGLGAASSPESAKALPSSRLQIATFGGGCFWCLEAIFQQLRGVRKVTSGYSGGWVKNPTYKQVCTGTTGHAEVIQILFDPQEISYEELVEIFFAVHDPTTPNRQGPDVGPQYRSIILYHSPEQRSAALRIKQRLEHSGQFSAPIVTEIVPFEAFYPAEDYHQNYFRQNPNQPYCQAVIAPKLQKFQKRFSQKLQPTDSQPPSAPPGP